MTTNLHWYLLRPWCFLLFVGYLAIILGTITRYLPTGPQQSDTTAFLWGSILWPLAIGIPLAVVVHEVMHRPFAFWVPNARRRLICSHAVVTSGFALVCALVTSRLNHEVPFLVIASVALAMLALPLPLEPGLRWGGSGKLSLIVVAALGAVVMRVGDIQAFAIAHPLVISALALGVTALNFGVAFSLTRRRARALVSYTSYFSAALTPELMARMRSEAIARKPSSRSQWRVEKVDDSLTAWVRVAFYERFGQMRGGWTGHLLLLGAVLVGLGLIFTERDASRLAIGQTFTVLSFLFVAIFTQPADGLRATGIYPISRQRRAAVAFVASAWQLGMTFGVVLMAKIIVAGINVWRLGVAFSPSAVGGLLLPLLCALPFIPAFQWAKLYVEVRNDRHLVVLGIMVALLVPRVGTPLFEAVGAKIDLATALALIGVGIIGSQMAYYAALRRFYRQGDLVQRGAVPAKLSLG